MNEIYQPTYLPQVPAGAQVGYDQSGRPVYLAPQQQAPAPVYVQMPAASEPIPAWIRNGLLVAVGLLILCTPATVLLVVAGPALEATGEGIAYGGIGIGIAAIAIAAGIKALRETPKTAKASKGGKK